MTSTNKLSYAADSSYYKHINQKDNPIQLNEKYKNRSTAPPNIRYQSQENCSICKKSNSIYSNPCQIHKICNKCLGSSEFPKNILKIGKKCICCKPLIQETNTEILNISSSNSGFIQTLPRNLRPEHKIDLKTNKYIRTIKPSNLVEFDLQQGFFDRFRKCKLCKEKSKEYIMICKKHKLCEKCLLDHLVSKKYPNREIKCKSCCDYFSLSINDTNLYLDDQSKNGNMIQEKFKVEVNSNILDCDGKDFSKTKYQIISDEAQVSRSIKKLPQQYIKEDREQVKIYQTWDKLNSLCENCSSDEKPIGLLCNHNFCLSCISVSCLKEILIYDEKKHYKQKKFYYHCPVCNCTIDIPTRMIINHLKNKDLIKSLSINQDHINTQILPRIAFYDGTSLD